MPAVGQQQGSGGPSKPNASPRPSILRKRPDYDSGSASKACKNLTGALSSGGGSSSNSCPPSPKRPDSRGGNSATSTGSATLSADSSPGEINVYTIERLILFVICWTNALCPSFNPIIVIFQLSKIAASILSSPPTSTAVERSFSKHAWIHLQDEIV